MRMTSASADIRLAALHVARSCMLGNVQKIQGHSVWLHTNQAALYKHPLYLIEERVSAFIL